MIAIGRLGVAIVLLAGGAAPAIAQNAANGSGSSRPAAAPTIAPGAPGTQTPYVNPSAAGTQLRTPNHRAPGGPGDAPSSYALSPSDKNPFSAAEARRLIEARRYRQVSGLRLDRSKIWQADATRNGQTVRVGLDARGIVAEE